MPALTPDQRKTRARAAAHARWAKQTDRSAGTAAARRAFLERFEHEVDPYGELSPNNRLAAAQSALQAHMLSLALKSSQKRASRAC